MDDSKIINKKCITPDMIFYPNHYLVNKNEYKIIGKTDFSPVLLSN